MGLIGEAEAAAQTKKRPLAQSLRPLIQQKRLKRELDHRLFSIACKEKSKHKDLAHARVHIIPFFVAIIGNFQHLSKPSAKIVRRVVLQQLCMRSKVAVFSLANTQTWFLRLRVLSGLVRLQKIQLNPINIAKQNFTSKSCPFVTHFTFLSKEKAL